MNRIEEIRIHLATYKDLSKYRNFAKDIKDLLEEVERLTKLNHEALITDCEPCPYDKSVKVWDKENKRLRKLLESMDFQSQCSWCGNNIQIQEQALNPVKEGDKT